MDNEVHDIYEHWEKTDSVYCLSREFLYLYICRALMRLGSGYLGAWQGVRS